MDKVDRLRGAYENKSSNYFISGDDMAKDCFHKQFYFLYKARIDSLSERITRNAEIILGKEVKLSQLADVSNNVGNFFVIGIVLKKMKYRRSVLYDFAEEETLDFEFRNKFYGNSLVSDDDVLEFEGDQQIIKLIGNVDKDRFVTGTVMGIYGHITRDDLFEVQNVIFPKLAQQIPWPIIEEDCYVAFISGLSLTGNITENVNVLYALEKMSSWLCAETYLSESEINIVKNITRLIIAGDSVRITKGDMETQGIGILGCDHGIDKGAIEQFDKLLSRLVSTIPVDVMSGPNDPTSVLLPQQPIPRMVFPWARRFGKLLNTVTNPYKFTLNGITFLGTSGQNINDLSRLTVGQTPLELMEECLARGHFCPTVPDSVDGFPFQGRDPFVVDELPHVFFTGNQQHLDQTWMNRSETGAREKRTLLLTIPAFKRQTVLTLLNLKNMRVTEYDFSQDENFMLRV